MTPSPDINVSVVEVVRTYGALSRTHPWTQEHPRSSCARRSSGTSSETTPTEATPRRTPFVGNWRGGPGGGTGKEDWTYATRISNPAPRLVGLSNDLSSADLKSSVYPV